MSEHLLASAGSSGKGRKRPCEGLVVHILDVPAAVALDAPTDLYVACYGNEGVTPGLEPPQRDCIAGGGHTARGLSPAFQPLQREGIVVIDRAGLRDA